MAGIISDQLIDNLRVTAYKQLVTPAKVWRKVDSEGPYGTTQTDTLVATVMCWYIPEFKGNLNIQPGGQVGHGSGAEFRFRHDQDIRIGDRLEVNDEPGFVVQDLNAGATIQLYLKAWTKRLE